MRRSELETPPAPVVAEASPRHTGGQAGAGGLYYDSPAAARSHYMLRRHYACHNLARIAREQQRTRSRSCLRVWRDLWTLDSFNELLRWNRGHTMGGIAAVRPVLESKVKTSSQGSRRNQSSPSTQFRSPPSRQSPRHKLLDAKLLSPRDQTDFRRQLKAELSKAHSAKVSSARDAGLQAINEERKARTGQSAARSPIARPAVRSRS